MLAAVSAELEKTPLEGGTNMARKIIRLPNGEYRELWVLPNGEVLSSFKEALEALQGQRER